MKKMLVAIGFLSLVLVGTFRSVHARATPVNRVINRLVGFEYAPDEYTPQISFEFLHPLYYEREESSTGGQVTIYFPGMRLADFTRLKVAERIKESKEVASVKLSFESDKVPRVALTIRFIRDHHFMLREVKYERPNLLVIDIYTKETLEKLRGGSTTIFNVCNESSICGLSPSVRGLSRVKKKRKLLPHKAHIVIDAGHGGRDNGATALGVKEKSVTLDIARRVYVSLKRAGYRVFLTRNDDKYLSVVDRSQLAKQLKADLFVSVHANAVSGLRNVSGIETHYLKGSPFFLENTKLVDLFLLKMMLIDV